MTARTLTLPEKHLLTTKLLRACLSRVEPALRIQLGCGRKIQHVLKLRHMAYVNPIKNREPLFHGMNRITIKISSTKLELGEILHRAQAALGTVNLLIEQPAQAYRVQSKTPFLRPDIRAEMKLRGSMSVHMAVEASHAQAGLCTFAVIGWVKLFLRKGSE